MPMEFEDYSAQTDAGESRSRRAEMWAGLALLLGVIGFVLYNYVKQEWQVAHYHAGLQALEARDPEKALAELRQADGYLDSAARISSAEEHVQARDRLYAEAEALSEEGKWFLAARRIVEMQQHQAIYRDSDALLARAREVNGPFFHVRGWVATPPGQGPAEEVVGGRVGVLESDGEKRCEVPGGRVGTRVLAISPDGTKLAYALASGETLLYNASSRATYTLTLLPDSPAGVREALFAHGASTLFIETNDKVYTFDLPSASTPSGPLQPVSEEHRGQWEGRSMRSLTLLTNSDGATEVAVRTSSSLTPRVLAVERGRLDGAIFTESQRYLMYRVCSPQGDRRVHECSLRLADLDSAAPLAYTIATIPELTASELDTALLGDFTRDGRGILFTIRYRGDSEALLYNIDTRQTSKVDPLLFSVTTGRGANDMYAVGEEYLINDHLPGLGSWQGANSLAHTEQNIRRPWDSFTRVRRHWLAITPNDRYLLALSMHITESTRFYRLSVAPLAWGSAQPPNRGSILLSTERPPDEWLRSLRLLPDGYTLLASTRTSAQSDYAVQAFSLDTPAAAPIVLLDGARLLPLYTPATR